MECSNSMDLLGPAQGEKCAVNCSCSGNSGSVAVAPSAQDVETSRCSASPYTCTEGDYRTAELLDGFQDGLTEEGTSGFGEIDFFDGLAVEAEEWPNAKPLPPDAMIIGEGDEIEAKSIKCKCQFCPACSLAAAIRLREKIRPIVEKWNCRVTMVTLTFDQANFESPLAAMKAAQKGKWIPKFRDKLFRRGLLVDLEYISVLEFQKNGWPHWHLILKVTPLGWKKLNVGGRLKDLWGHGAAHESSEEMNPKHACHYVTKYVAKQDVGIPDWAKKLKTIKKLNFSLGLNGEPQPAKPHQGGKRKTRTIGERMASCERQTNIFRAHKELIRYTKWCEESKEYKEHTYWRTRRQWLTTKAMMVQDVLNHKVFIEAKLMYTKGRSLDYVLSQSFLTAPEKTWRFLDGDRSAYDRHYTEAEARISETGADLETTRYS